MAEGEGSDGDGANVETVRFLSLKQRDQLFRYRHGASAALGVVVAGTGPGSACGAGG